MNHEQIGKVIHAANMAFCETIGDMSQRPWEEAEQWQRDGAIDMVKRVIDDPTYTAERSHEDWNAYKLANGWKHGPVKDGVKKEHPCLVPYSDLSFEQKLKDHLVINIIKAFIVAESDR